MIYLLLGTNLGDRQWNLESAISRIAGELKTDILYSDVMETEAVGFEGNDFLNQIIAFDSDIEPDELLDICQRIEVEMGRPQHEAEYDGEGRRIYHNRIIDIDILTFNDRVIATERLTVPHPQLEERPFVKEILKTLMI